MGDDALITLARIEVKVDTLLLSASDHETRLRELEKPRGYVTARQLWTGLVGSAALMSGLGTVLALVLR
jgi:hypothetical protein